MAGIDEVAERGTGLPRPAAILIATLVAPAAAGPGAFFVMDLLRGDLIGAMLSPLQILSRVGIYAYIAAFLPVLVLGIPLTVAAGHSTIVRRKWFAIVTGAALGLLLGVAVPFPIPLYLFAASGAACALVYRLIVGLSFGGLDAGRTSRGLGHCRLTGMW